VAKETTVSQHTPGPWKWESLVDTHSLEPDVLSIYESHGGGMAPGEADARLIEAAPDLLAALKKIRDEPISNLSICFLMREIAHDAIAKATEVKP